MAVIRPDSGLPSTRAEGDEHIIHLIAKTERATMLKKSRPPRRKRRQQRRERRDPFATSIPKGTKRTIGRSTTRETPLHVRARGVEIDGTATGYIRRHAGFKLGKHALNITRVTVLVEDSAGPNGAPQSVCRMRVILPAKREVVVTATARSWRPAFDTALAATERAIRRLVRQGRT
jgi:hypothetical protein